MSLPSEAILTLAAALFMDSPAKAIHETIKRGGDESHVRNLLSIRYQRVRNLRKETADNLSIKFPNFDEVDLRLATTEFVRNSRRTSENLASVTHPICKALTKQDLRKLVESLRQTA